MSSITGEKRVSGALAPQPLNVAPGEDINGRLVDFTLRQSLILRIPPTSKVKRVRFYRNGDCFYKGVLIAVTPERYRSFDSLMADLTRILADSVNLPSGVRVVFNMDGHKVNCLDDLEDGKWYVCSGFGEAFKRVEYTVSSTRVDKWNRPPKSLASINSVVPVIKTGTPDFVSPRIVTLIRNGPRPRKIVQLLLNKRNSPSFDHVLSNITEAVKLDSGACRKVYNQNGTQLTQLEDFFDQEDVFFTYGVERFCKDDLDLDHDEVRIIQSRRRRHRSGNFSLYGLNRCTSPKPRQHSTGSPNRSSPKPMPKMPVRSKKNINANHDYLSTGDSPRAVASPVKSKYKIGRQIGNGNFAVVRQCVDRNNGNEYALKIIDKSKCQGKEHMIESEVEILRLVNHPNIIRLIAEHDSPCELYLVMELVKGGDLFDAIAACTNFSETDSRIMIHNLASALLYLHTLQIVHRDIKPENLLVELVNGIKVLKLGDFGLAQRVTEPLFTVCGTPTYVAPEILSEVGYGLKIDVWAAGVILYILLCGFPPFVSANNNQEELFDCILSGQYEFSSPYWDNVSDPAKDLITHMLQVQPELRFSAEDVLDHIWLFKQDSRI